MTIRAGMIGAIAAASAALPAPTDPFFANVKALMHFDGADGSTTMEDIIGHTFTANGNAQLDTSEFKFGTASLLLDGTGDYIDTPDSDDWNVGSGDFTVECWVRFAALGATFEIICGQANSALATASLPFSLQKSDAGKFRFNAFSGGSNVIDISSTTSPSNGVWYHVAATRVGTAFRIFVDGVLEASGTSSATLNNSTNKFAIGRWGEFDGAYVNGRIDDFRFTKGVGRYTANFTPPSAPFPDS